MYKLENTASNPDPARHRHILPATHKTRHGKHSLGELDRVGITLAAQYWWRFDIANGWPHPRLGVIAITTGGGEGDDRYYLQISRHTESVVGLAEQVDESSFHTSCFLRLRCHSSDKRRVAMG